jgi:hypothetical protein
MLEKIPLEQMFYEINGVTTQQLMFEHIMLKSNFKMLEKILLKEMILEHMLLENVYLE